MSYQTKFVPTSDHTSILETWRLIDSMGIKKANVRFDTFLAALFITNENWATDTAVTEMGLQITFEQLRDKIDQLRNSDISDTEFEDHLMKDARNLIDDIIESCPTNIEITNTYIDEAKTDN